MSDALIADDVLDAARRAVAAAVDMHPELTDVERLLSQLVDGVSDPASAALLRLLDGAESDTDVAGLGMPLIGARVVVVKHEDARVRSSLRAVLDGERDALVVAHDGALVALARNVPHRAGDDKSLRMAARLAVLAARQAPDVRVGISSSLSAPDEIAAAARDAGDAADLAAPGSSLCVDQVWADVVLARIRRLLPQCLPGSHPLVRLLAHDRRVGSELARTVAVWLHRHRDATATADELLVHPNTLRYRLRRAQSVSGLDLDDPAQSSAAYLLLANPGRQGGSA